MLLSLGEFLLCLEVLKKIIKVRVGWSVHNPDIDIQFALSDFKKNTLKMWPGYPATPKYPKSLQAPHSQNCQEHNDQKP